MRAVPGSSVRAVRRVARLDGRTRIVAVRSPGCEWQALPRRMRFTREAVRRLQADGVSSVVLRRWFRGVSIPLSWLGLRQQPAAPTEHRRAS